MMYSMFMLCDSTRNVSSPCGCDCCSGWIRLPWLAAHRDIRPDHSSVADQRRQLRSRRCATPGSQRQLTKTDPLRTKSTAKTSGGACKRRHAERSIQPTSWVRLSDCGPPAQLHHSSPADAHSQSELAPSTRSAARATPFTRKGRPSAWEDKFSTTLLKWKTSAMITAVVNTSSAVAVFPHGHP
jgi:hypothetical protein